MTASSTAVEASASSLGQMLHDRVAATPHKPAFSHPTPAGWQSLSWLETGRRVEQVIGLTYDTTADQMEEIVAELRRLIVAEHEVDPASVICYFRDYSASSLDIWMVFNVTDPDFHKHMALRQRLSLAFMRAVESRGLSFAFPTQTIHLARAEEKPEAVRKP